MDNLNSMLIYPLVPLRRTEPLTIITLPSEMIYHILSYCGPDELHALSFTSGRLRAHAISDEFWSKILLETLPSCTRPLPDPGPAFKNYRELYLAFKNLWFIVRNPLWMSDWGSGILTLARYDWKKGVIEITNLGIFGKRPNNRRWPGAFPGLIKDFQPVIFYGCPLGRKNPPKMTVQPRNCHLSRTSESYASPWGQIRRAPPRDGVVLTYPDAKESRDLRVRTSAGVAGTEPIWPSLNVPMTHRLKAVKNKEWARSQHDIAVEQKPADGTPYKFLFRYKSKNWDRMHNDGLWDVTSFASFPPEVYTPTEDCPFRGIWAGTFSHSSAEFFLFKQYNTTVPTDNPGAPRRMSSSIQAVKLDGHELVPGGELAFIAPEVLQPGHIGYVHIPPGPNEENLFFAPVVCAHVQVGADSNGNYALPQEPGAAAMFLGSSGTRGSFVTVDLMLLSHNCVAILWLESNQISVFRRLLVDEMIERIHNMV